MSLGLVSVISGTFSILQFYYSGIPIMSPGQITWSLKPTTVKVQSLHHDSYYLVGTT